MMTDRLYTPSEMDDWLRGRQRLSLIAAGVACLAVAIGIFIDADQFFRSYLMSFLMCVALALGCLSLEMLQYLTGGKWGLSIERILQAASNTLPLVAILFIPVALGVHALYPWSHPEVVRGDEVLRHKQIYLNLPFFIVRAVLFFAVWTAGAWFLHRFAENQRDRASYVAVRRISAVGLIVYVFTLTFRRSTGRNLCSRAGTPPCGASSSLPSTGSPPYLSSLQPECSCRAIRVTRAYSTPTASMIWASFC